MGTGVSLAIGGTPALRASSSSRLGRAWPRESYRALHEVVLCSDRLAILAWRRWLRTLPRDLGSLDLASVRLLVAAANRLGSLEQEHEVLRRARKLERHFWLTNQARIGHLCGLLESLANAEVPTLALKGSAALLAEQERASARGMFDVDVLVHPEHSARATEVVSTLGWRPLARLYGDRSLPGNAPEAYSAQFVRSGVELDLHWHVLEQDRSVSFDASFWRHKIRVGTSGLCVPSATERLLHACLHGLAFSCTPPMQWPLDAAAAIAEGVDWSRIERIAEERRLILPVYDALRYLRELEADVPDDVLQRLGRQPISHEEDLEYGGMADPASTTLQERVARRHQARQRAQAKSGSAPVSLEVLPISAAEGASEPVTAAEPLISCLCVTENRPEFIPWLLWNYDKQTWRRRELVIVDSSDPPVALPNRPDVRIVRIEHGAALGSKRNAALDTARGEFLAWFDDDDWQHPERLERLATAFIQGGSAEASHVAVDDGWFVDLVGRRCTRYHAPGVTIFNGSLFASSAARQCRFVDHLRSAEDTVWVRDLGRHFGRKLHAGGNGPLFFWLCHDRNTTNARQHRVFERPLDDLQGALGEAWEETSQQIAALRSRLHGERAMAEKSNGASRFLSAYVSNQARRSSARPRLWVVTPCMGRLAHLRETAPKVIGAGRFGYCLVDYSCPDGSGAWMETHFAGAVEEGRCVVARVPGQRRFNKAAAHNAGALRALEEGAEVLCFLDADTVVEAGLFERVLERIEDEAFLIAGLDDSGRDVPSLTGLLALTARSFAATEGFDETFQGWGSEDVEMRVRLHVLHGYRYADVPNHLLKPIQHEDDLRTRHYETKDIARSDRQNFLRLLKKLRAWPRSAKLTGKAAISRLFYQGPAASSAVSAASVVEFAHSPSAIDRTRRSPGAQGSSGLSGAERAVTWQPQPVAVNDRRVVVNSQAAKASDLHVGLADRSVVGTDVADRSLEAPYFEHIALRDLVAFQRSWLSGKCYVGLRSSIRTFEEWTVLARRVGTCSPSIDAHLLEARAAVPIWQVLNSQMRVMPDLAHHVLVRRMGLPSSVLTVRAPYVAENRWLMRPAVLEEFVSRWLQPALTVLADEDDSMLRRLLEHPVVPGGCAFLRRSLRHLHVSYEPYFLERLAPTFLVHSGLRIGRA